MSFSEINEVREDLIGQGVNIPDLDNQYYNLDDKFDNFSCITGDYRATSTITDASSVCVKVESDIDTDVETMYDSDTVTLCNSSHYISQASTPSTPSGTSGAYQNGTAPVIITPVGVNDEHEGMSYDLLIDGAEAYDYKETIVQTGNTYY